MRQIEVEAGLRIRFPRRSDDFDDGVEVGLAVALMALRGPELNRPLAASNVEQLTAIADKLGYHLSAAAIEGGLARVTLRPGRPRPSLTLVHDDPGAARAPSSGRQPSPVLRLARGIGAPERADPVKAGQAS